MSQAISCLSAQDLHPNDQPILYQSSLRAIGAYLDAHCRSQPRVLELPNGFDVSSYATGSQGNPEHKLFTHAELLAQGYGPFHRKIRVFRKGVRVESRYQDLFRALGHLLEKSRAYLILLDEVDDGFLLTYQHYSQDAGFMLRKGRVLLSGEDEVVLLRSAVAHRARG
jgi:hypothetical protein